MPRSRRFIVPPHPRSAISADRADTSGWGSTTAGIILLGVVLPILFARPTLQSITRLSVLLAWLISIYSGWRLWALALDGRDRVISITFWLFIYVWLGLCALANTVSQQFPLFNQTYGQATQVSALLTIIIGLVGYEISRLVARSRRSVARASRVLNAPTLRMPRVTWVGVAGIAVVFYYTHKYGLATRFSSRASRVGAFFSSTPETTLFLHGNKESGLIQITADWILVFLALYHWLLYRRQYGLKSGQNPATSRKSSLVALARALHIPPLRRAFAQNAGTFRSRPVRAVYFVCLVIAVILAENPISNPRYQFGGVTIALILAAWPLANAKLVRLFITGLLLAALFVYPYADAFRYDKPVLRLSPLNSQFRTSADFSMFQQELNAQVYVHTHGHTWGRQLEGTVLGFVPRAYWPSKPGTTGNLVLGIYSQVLPASMSIFGWAFVDGGAVWVFLFLMFYGWTSGMLEEAYIRRPRERVSLAAAAAPLFAAFQVILLRGDPQTSFTPLLPLAIVVLAVCARPRHGRVTMQRGAGRARNGDPTSPTKRERALGRA